MKSIKRVTLIRHGESEWNAAGRWQGHGDAPLSERGRQQAQALARRLVGTPVAHRECSDLQRAAHTAAALGEARPDVAWREVDVGIWEGLTQAEMRARHPEELAALRRGEQVAMGGGETLLDLQARVRGAFDRLVARMAPGENAQVVCHGGVILSLVSNLLGIPDTFNRPIGRPGNTSITTLEVGPGGLEVTVYNDGAHAEVPERGRDGAAVEQLVAGMRDRTRRARRVLNGDPQAPARLGPARVGRVGHLVRHPHGEILWDWNVRPDQRPDQIPH